MMNLGVMATITRPSPAEPVRAFIASAHVVTVSECANGVMVDTIRGVMHVTEVEGLTGDDVMVDTFVECMRAVGNQAELLERIHAAAWDVTQTPTASCYLRRHNVLRPEAPG